VAAHGGGVVAWQDTLSTERVSLVVVGDAFCAPCWAAERDLFRQPAAEALSRVHPVVVDAHERPQLTRRLELAADQLIGHHKRPFALLVHPNAGPYAALAIRDDTLFSWVAEEAGAEGAEARAQRLAADIDTRPSIRAVPGPEVQTSAMANLLVQEDREYGGFGMQKHSQASTLAWLLDRRARGVSDAAPVMKRSLAALRLGGLHDHFGGGFFHETRDASWQFVALDKRLEDNALLLRLFADLAALEGESGDVAITREIVGWLDDALGRKDGTYAAGTVAFQTYYLWSREQVNMALPGADGRRMISSYHIQDATVPYLTSPLPEMLVPARRALVEARRLREPPAVDERRPLGGNALMVSALLRASVVLDATNLAIRAEALATELESVRTHHLGGEYPATVADLAWLGHALLDLYGHRPNARWLDAAERVGADLSEELSRPAYQSLTDDHGRPDGVGDALRFLHRLGAQGRSEPHVVDAWLGRGARSLSGKAAGLHNASLLRAHDRRHRPQVTLRLKDPGESVFRQVWISRPWPGVELVVDPSQPGAAAVCIGESCRQTPSERALRLTLVEAVAE
jgi:uncharacterized protein